MANRDTNNKQQHWVAAAYLKPWCNHSTGRTPFLWRCRKDGSEIKARSPKNIFRENNLYTQRTSSGERDLRVEAGFEKLERSFLKVCREKIDSKQPLDPDDRAHMVLYASAQLARTPTFLNHHRKQWGGILEKMDRLADRMKKEERRNRKPLPPTLSSGSPSISHDEVRAIASNPVQTIMRPFIEGVSEILIQMPYSIFCTDDEVGFITSDRPCTMFDPDLYKRPPLFRAPALGSRTVEFSLPLSPCQSLMFHWHKEYEGYFPLPNLTLVDELNRRTRGMCHQFFVVNKKVTKPIWYDLGTPPPGYVPGSDADEEGERH